MTKPRIKLNMRGVNELMRSQPVQDLTDAIGEGMAAQAGSNFEYVRRGHRWTARGYVQPANVEGMREEARDKKLTGVLGAARSASVRP